MKQQIYLGLVFGIVACAAPLFMWLLFWEFDRRLTIENAELYEAKIMEMAPFFDTSHRTLANIDPRYPRKKSRGVEVKIQYVDADGESKQFIREYPLPLWDYHKPGDEIVLVGFSGMAPYHLWFSHPKVSRVISKYANPTDQLSTAEIEKLACLKRELADAKEMILDMRQYHYPYSPTRFEALRTKWESTH